MQLSFSQQYWLMHYAFWWSEPSLENRDNFLGKWNNRHALLTDMDSVEENLL